MEQQFSRCSKDIGDSSLGTFNRRNAEELKRKRGERAKGEQRVSCIVRSRRWLQIRLCPDNITLPRPEGPSGLRWTRQAEEAKTKEEEEESQCDEGGGTDSQKRRAKGEMRR